MKKVLQQVLQEIKPNAQEQEHLTRTTKEILSKIIIPHTTVFPGGSGAKGTWLKGNHDIDIYVQFSKEHYAGENISSILGKTLQKNFKLTVLHGSRDYYQAIYNGYMIEFIPLFHIKKAHEATNITDVSPLHSIYVKKHKKQDDIRLFKAFCKAQGIYGAESYTQGFSGYVCEILVIHYGSFPKTLRAISKWKTITHIGKEQHIKRLNIAKKQSPLILLDPVDPYRNAAAALGQEPYDTLIKAAKTFLKKPSINSFRKQEITFETLRKKYPAKKILVYTVEPLENKHDIVGAKLRKGIEYLEQRLTNQEFIVEKTYWTWNKIAYYYFVLDAKPLSYLKKHQGPPLDNPKAVESFTKTWKNYPIEKKGKHLLVTIPRDYQLPEDYLTHMIKTDKSLKNYMKHMKRV